jgi:hypothetical protein
MVTLMTLHATVMFFPGMLVRKESRMFLPGSIMLTVGMMPLIVTVPAWSMALSMLLAIMLSLVSILVSLALILYEFWWIATFIGMSVAGNGILRQHKTCSSHRSQQYRGNSYFFIHDVPPCIRYGQDCP